MCSIYEDLIPKKVLFSLKEIEQMGIIKTSMSKKLILQRKLEIVKIGNKNHISRIELIRYLDENTISLNSIEFSQNKNIA
ncbi:FAD-binding protein [Halarcobacter mediterraneus]|uniref:FAD-binding protein n=1 Tax=Halarcobacter mediterraneus TaxID=2023153 RepID=A0A4Q1B646_9BACT|nr:DNA-binding protein [Halarcobacter mediterraneus]RXK14029.1 FAD-binding protein [Halarcobacter mediterraneus]